MSGILNPALNPKSWLRGSEAVGYRFPGSAGLRDLAASSTRHESRLPQET